MKEKIYQKVSSEKQKNMWNPNEGTQEAQEYRMNFLKEVTSASAILPQTFDAVKHFGAKALIDAYEQGYKSTLFTRTHSEQEEARVGEYLVKARDRMHGAHNISYETDNPHTKDTMHELMNSFTHSSQAYLNELSESIDKCAHLLTLQQ